MKCIKFITKAGHALTAEQGKLPFIYAYITVSFLIVEIPRDDLWGLMIEALDQKNEFTDREYELITKAFSPTEFVS